MCRRSIPVGWCNVFVLLPNVVYRTDGTRCPLIKLQLIICHFIREVETTPASRKIDFIPKIQSIVSIHIFSIFYFIFLYRSILLLCVVLVSTLCSSFVCYLVQRPSLETKKKQSLGSLHATGQHEPSHDHSLSSTK